MARRSRQAPIGDSHATFIVVWFQIRRILRSLILFVLAVAILGAAGAYVVAFLGPEDGVVRKTIERYGLMPGVAALKRAAEENLAAARQAYERGDVLDLERAEYHVARARKADPKNGAVAADQALMMTEHADALHRWSADLELEAQDAKPEQARQLRELAKVKRAQAEKLLADAGSALKEAMQLAPGTLETMRAQARFLSLSKDEASARRYLDRAKALADKPAGDPWTGAIEASMAPSGTESVQRLRRVLEASPDFYAARVQLARALIAQNAVDLAQKELDVVSAKLQMHGEVRRLLARLQAVKARRSGSG